MESFQRATAILLRDAPPALRGHGVEALLVDQTSFGGRTVADALELPFVSVSCALLLNSEPAIPPANTGWRYSPAAWARLRNRLGQKLLNRLTKPITQVVLDYRQQHNLPVLTHSSQAWSPLAQICQQPAAFEYPRRELPGWFHFTGPLVDPASRAAAPFPWDQLNGKPLIYASLGTIQNQQLEVFARSAEALPPLPAAPLVVGFAPQLELLQRAALTITHAGLNTVLESLSCGVPIKRATVARLRSAIERVLGDPFYRLSAQRLQRAIAASAGVTRAADIVEQAISSGQPVL